MKKAITITTIALLLIMVFFTVACGNTSGQDRDDDPFASGRRAVMVTSDIHNFLPAFGKLVKSVSEKEPIIPSVMLNGGDFAQNFPYYSIEDVVEGIDKINRSAWGTVLPRAYTMGNHDWDLVPENPKSETAQDAFYQQTGNTAYGLQYSDKTVEVFTLGYAEFPASNQYDMFSQLYVDIVDEYLAGMAGSGKLVLLLSHIPLHESKNSEGGARIAKYSYELTNVINKYADDVDIVFFWGHCHSYHVEDKWEIAIPGTTLKTYDKNYNVKQQNINFYYANSGAGTEDYRNIPSLLYLSYNAKQINFKYYLLNGNKTDADVYNEYTVNRLT